MELAPTYIASIVMLLVTILPLFGVQVGSEQLTTTLQTIVQIVTGIVIAIRQLQTRRSTIAGTRPQ